MASTISPPSAPLDVLGSQTPRLCHIPDSVATSYSEVEELLGRARLILDDWQGLVLKGSLGERADGKWAARRVGVSVARQNGKNVIALARQLAGLFIFDEERLLIHSAHEQRTSSEHFRRLVTLLESVPEFDRKVQKVTYGKGSEAIEMLDGTRILFITRTGPGARGMTGDYVNFDEAMILSASSVSSIVPTLSAKSMHGNPQFWYMGSAVDQEKHEHGVEFARQREAGIRGDDRVAWFEWSAPGDHPDDLSDADRDNPELWAQANPGLGIRISAEFVADERSGLLGPREFAVERLGVGDWPAADGGESVIDLAVWASLEDHESAIATPITVAIDVPPDRSRAVIAVAGHRDDGLLHVEVVPDRRHGTGWVAERVASIIGKHPTSKVVLDQVSPAGSLITELEDRGVVLTLVGAREHAQACGAFYDAVKQEKLKHLGQPELTAALKGAVKRPLVDAWAWSRKGSNANISPLVACTLALWGAGGVPTGGGFEW